MNQSELSTPGVNTIFPLIFWILLDENLGGWHDDGWDYNFTMDVCYVYVTHGLQCRRLCSVWDSKTPKTQTLWLSAKISKIVEKKKDARDTRNNSKKKENKNFKEKIKTEKRTTSHEGIKFIYMYACNIILFVNHNMHHAQHQHVRPAKKKNTRQKNQKDKT